jgi:fructose-bisphosphate aldolase, class I
MDSRTGKKIRMGRLFDQQSKRTIIVAYSHGVLLGPIDGLATREQLHDRLSQLSAADGVMIAPGLITQLEDHFVGKEKPSLVVHLDWTNFSRKTLPYDQGAQVSLATMEQIAASGADAVMTYLLMGPRDTDREAIEIERNAKLARECERLGLLLMIEPRGAFEREKPELKADLDVMKLYCRISAEIGADFIKIIWPGSIEACHALVENTPAPLLIAGGAKQDDPANALQLAKDVMASKAAGLVFGRNIYQSANPKAALSQFRQIVHGRP